MNGLQIPRPDLAGLCRAAAERKQEPVTITSAMLTEPLAGAPFSFEEKRSYFLHLLYDVWGKEHRKKTIDTFDDFPLASAVDAEEFCRIIESLLDDGSIRYDNKSVVRGDWKNNIQAHYHNVLLTPAGKRLIVSPSTASHNMAATSFTFGDGAKVNLVQGAGAVQTNVSGDNASVNVARGNHNAQTNQAGQAASLPELVEQIKQLFLDSAFDANREEINHEVKSIEVQLQKREPKKSILKRAFDSLQELAAESAGAVGGQAVFELLKRAPDLLAAAGMS